MRGQEVQDYIKVLIADDDEYVLECYREAFTEPESTREVRALDALSAELFDVDTAQEEEPKFEVTACSQGADAIILAKEAANDGHPFDVVILDVRMPPGIDGVETGSQIRELDDDVEIVFVSGYSDISYGRITTTSSATHATCIILASRFRSHSWRKMSSR